LLPIPIPDVSTYVLITHEPEYSTYADRLRMVCRALNPIHILIHTTYVLMFVPVASL
jgi:hypothetical protein